MNTMLTLIIVVQVLSALTIIALVLLQQGKGADMGAAFGSGASGSLFGASGSSNFLSKATGVAATVFFGATLALAFLGNQPASDAGVMDRLPATSVPVPQGDVSPPAVPGSSTAPAAPAEVPGAAAPASGAAGQSNQIPK